eukprot:scaffold51067_cov66-Phaeocystis_antarctica.AAC.11
MRQFSTHKAATRTTHVHSTNPLGQHALRLSYAYGKQEAGTLFLSMSMSMSMSMSTHPAAHMQERVPMYCATPRSKDSALGARSKM